MRNFLTGKEPDGIEYRVDYDSERRLYIVDVRHPKGKMLSKSFNQTFTPTFGMDVADVAEGEKILEELINKLRADNDAATAN